MILTQVDQPNQACQQSEPTLTGGALRAAIYLEFLYGFGVAPGLDLGAATTYSRIQTTYGNVYRQDFERGVTIANIGDEDVEIVLERPLYDLSNAKRTSVHLPAHSAEVLLFANRVVGPRRPS